MSLFNTNKTRISYISTETGEKVYPVLVDVKKGVQGGESIQFVSSDINTGILSVAFMLDNADYNVNGKDVVCTVQRPDTTTIELPCKHISNNVVEVHLGVNGTSQSGTYNFDFKIYRGNDEVVGTPILNYTVSQSIGNDMVVEDDDRLPILTELVSQLSTAKQQANTATNNANNATNNAVIATNKANTATNNANSAVVRAEETISNINKAIASGTQDLEVKEARDGEVSLKARLDRDIEKAKEIYVPIEGTYVSTDSSSGYAKDVEILGNTIQDASNLADIRSVGDKVEGQELYKIDVVSYGKNLFDGELRSGKYNTDTGKFESVANITSNVNYILVNSNTSYTINRPTLTGVNTRVLYYTKEMTYISSDLVVGNNSFVTPPNTSYINFHIATSSFDSSLPIQLEEGTQVTPYEPYQEDKLTILSPVQLEKVGDVADRIICKDGVWGIEKWIKTVVLKGNEDWVLQSTAEGDSVMVAGRCITPFDFIKPSTTETKHLCFPLLTKYHTNWNSPDIEGIHLSPINNEIFINILINKIGSKTLANFKTWLSNNPQTVKLQLAEPTFIPLPNSQQVKLRTFANKTNIHFETEIEGTIKAQVPKSLGATVNTHTEQIGNLSKELDRVKKLEESTVSTVTTESGFTTVEETSNGYFEDVKLEGKTLVNVLRLGGNWFEQETTLQTDSTTAVGLSNHQKSRDLSLLKNNTVYTVVPFVDYTVIKKGILYLQLNTEINGIQNAVFRITEDMFNKPTLITTKELTNKNSNSLFIGGANCEYKFKNVKILMLEGDHTQNPPEYFEGLKSVGQDVDEVSVESVKNLLDYTKIVNKVTDGTTGVITINNNRLSLDVKDRIEVYSPQIYVKCRDTLVAVISFAEKDGVPIYDSGYLPLNTTSKLSLPSEVKYITINAKKGNETPMSKEALKNVVIYHQADKKPLLYYNPTTQTWEKPILREWDSIEKHSDGKYYYHKRSNEIKLDGSENWMDGTVNGDYIRFSLSALNKGVGVTNILCDKFTTLDSVVIESIRGSNGSGSIYVNILKSKLSTQDEAGFKQWLQANNVTVVYQLAQEEVYECTNIDLLTYEGETNYIVNSGAISPKTILKVHNNISNVVKILQEKVSLLENKFIEGLKQVLAGDMYSLAELLYPEDFKVENSVMTIPLD